MNLRAGIGIREGEGESMRGENRGSAEDGMTREEGRKRLKGGR